MKRILFIQDSLENKISYYLLMCFLILLPFDGFYSETVFVCLALHTVIHLQKSRLALLFNRDVLILTLLYLYIVVALLYSRDKDEGLALVSSQLVLLLFPVIFTLNKLDLEKYKWPLIKAFGFTCTLVVVYLFGDAIHVIYYFHLPIASLFSKEFINQNFSQVLNLHATYFSMFVALSLTAFIVLLLREAHFDKKFFYGICSFILLAGLIQLSSRAVIIAMLLIIFIAFPLLVLQGKKKTLFIITALSLMAVVFLAVSQLSSFKYRFTGELKDDLTKPSAANNIEEPRIIRWNAAMELIKQSPVIGYGTGSERALLNEKYFEKGLYLSYRVQFNAHDQYLSFLLNLGAVGLFLFLLILYYGFYIGIKNKDILLVSLLIIITVTCISEDILNIKKGIYFYSFFISYFLILYKKQHEFTLAKHAEATPKPLPAF